VRTRKCLQAVARDRLLRGSELHRRARLPAAGSAGASAQRQWRKQSARAPEQWTATAPVRCCVTARLRRVRQGQLARRRRERRSQRSLPLERTREHGPELTVLGLCPDLSEAIVAHLAPIAATLPSTHWQASAPLSPHARQGTWKRKIAAEAKFSRDFSGHDGDQFEPWRWSSWSSPPSGAELANGLGAIGNIRRQDVPIRSDAKLPTLEACQCSTGTGSWNTRPTSPAAPRSTAIWKLGPGRLDSARPRPRSTRKPSSLRSQALPAPTPAHTPGAALRRSARLLPDQERVEPVPGSRARCSVDGSAREGRRYEQTSHSPSRKSERSLFDILES
jgi:hypothetical protein